MSLLWPYGKMQDDEPAVSIYGAEYGDDIRIANIFRQYSELCELQSGLSWNNIRQFLTCHKKTIEYRLDIIEGLLGNPDLCSRMENVVKNYELSMSTAENNSGISDAEQVSYLLYKMKAYVEAVTTLDSSLNTEGVRLSSTGLTKLRDSVAGMFAAESFQKLIKNLPLIENAYMKPSSVTIGVNFNDAYSPQSMVLESINEYYFNPPTTFFERIMLKIGFKNIFNALCFLQITKRRYDPRLVRKVNNFNNDVLKYWKNAKGVSVAQRVGFTPFLAELTLKQMRCLEYDKKMNAALYIICGSLFNQLSNEMYEKMKENSAFINTICEELNVLLSFVGFIKEIESMGIDMCRPEALPMADGKCAISNICNLGLAFDISRRHNSRRISALITYNDVNIEGGKPVVITGPNQGGKTTYAQAIVQSQVLFQLGMYVPGSKAAISPVNSIFTHFPAEEDKTLFKGRLGEECSRIADIFDKATPNSLIFINEAFSSTNGDEGLAIGRNVIEGLKCLKARSLFVTHYHELGEEAGVVSLVAGANIKHDENGSEKLELTHKIKQMPPVGRSYARNLARRYNIDLKSIAGKQKGRCI